VLRLDEDESDWMQLNGGDSCSAATSGLPGVHRHDEGYTLGSDHLLICIVPSVWPRSAPQHAKHAACYWFCQPLCHANCCQRVRRCCLCPYMPRACSRGGTLLMTYAWVHADVPALADPCMPAAITYAGSGISFAS